jgi:integrase
MAAIGALQAQRRKRPAGPRTKNAYLRSIKSFTRWLWRERRTPVDALANLQTFNEETDRRHVRRELTPDELAEFLRFVDADAVTHHNMTAPERSILYRLAFGTGFRRGELGSLTPASFELDADPPTVTAAAAYSKRRRQDVQPIRPDLAELLRPWIEGRPRGDRLFPRVPRHTARMIRQDLEGARAAWIKAARTDAERDARQRSDFLQAIDADGRVVDFHGTRHTYVSAIVAGGASVKEAQDLARHSDPRLTIGRYSHARLHDLTAALEALPPQAPEKATGSPWGWRRRGRMAETPISMWGQMWEQ